MQADCKGECEGQTVQCVTISSDVTLLKAAVEE